MTETLSRAFAGDPVWETWAFPDPERGPAERTAVWKFCVEAALDYGWIRVAEECAAVALWIPPGQPELPPDYEARFGPFTTDLLGARRGRQLLEGFDQFDSEHPHDEPHYYLSLLGTHPDHRGRGIGMRLLAESLALVDAQHAPAYLESSNPANIGRYEGVGFTRHGEFTLRDGPTVTTMWREAR